MNQIDKNRKAIIREAAKELRKKMVPNINYYQDHPWKFMPEYEFSMCQVCANKSEENFFEWIFVFGSEKAAREAMIFLSGFHDGIRAQEYEANIPQA